MLDEAIATCRKDPDASVPFTIDWSRFLPAGETISAVTWSIPSADLTEVSAANTTTTATVVISGGLAGHVYRATCQVTTAPGGYIDQRSIEIEVADR